MRKVILWVGVFLFFGTSSHGQEITLYTEDYKPFQYRNAEGALTGFGVELVRQIFRDAGVTIHGGQIRMYPWARAYANVREEKNSAVFMTVRTAKREQLFKWVGPLAPRKMWLYKLKKRTDIQLNRLADSLHYKIGGYNQSADTNYMLELGFNVQIVPTQRHITKMLVKERFDLMSSLELTMADRLRDLGFDQSVVAKTILLDDRYNYYLAVNPQTADVLVSRLQAALDQIRQSGRYEGLWNKYAQ